MNETFMTRRITNLFYRITVLLTLIFLGNYPYNVKAQQYKGGDSILQLATLENVVQYALKHQPIIQQALIDEKIVNAQVRSQLSRLLPQISLNYLLQHNFQVPTSFVNGNAIPLGVGNTSAFQFGVTQNIFSSELFIANRTRGDVLLQTTQTTTSQRITVVSDASKAFYDIISTEQQIRVAQEDIVRLERSLKDATAQYTAGVADKIDYKRATITLNNTRANLRSNEQLLRAKTEYLKNLIGYPVYSPLQIVYDSAQMERDAFIDTTEVPDYTKRIEYDLLQTQRRLLEANLKFYKLSYLPTVTINGGYNFNYQNKNFAKVYGNNFPSSFGQLVVSLPIFTGGRRKADIDAAQWQLKRNDWDIYNLRNSINSEFAQAKATYLSNYINYLTLKENVALAQEVYDVVQLQYRSGIKAYLEVVTAEAELRTSRINYYQALYELLSSKVDVQRSLGQIRY
jgi:outer membrane protein